LLFYAASADSTAQTGHAGAGDWQEEIYQMVRHDIDIIPFGTPFIGMSQNPLKGSPREKRLRLPWSR